MNRLSKYNFILFVLIIPYIGLLGQQSDEIITVTESFDEDPGWENVNNRVICSDCPEINQNFGWAPTDHNGSGIGEIGGTIYRSTTPSFYALPLGEPLTFKDEFSASGNISVIAPKDEGFGFYFGFFNAERQGWRVWSSCGVRIGKMKEGIGRFHLDYKTGEASGAILNPDLAITGDGSVHNWELKYEPHITVADYKWPDPRTPDLFPAESPYKGHNPCPAPSRLPRSSGKSRHRWQSGHDRTSPAPVPV